MTTLNFPIHMKLAFRLAIDSYAKSGFVYSFENVQDHDVFFTVEVNASEQQIMDLGIKIGYRQNGEAAEIDKLYERYLTLQTEASTEAEERQANLIFDKLRSMFPSKAILTEYLNAKAKV